MLTNAQQQGSDPPPCCQIILRAAQACVEVLATPARTALMTRRHGDRPAQFLARARLVEYGSQRRGDEDSQLGKGEARARAQVVELSWAAG